jgi:hypothetical protein
MADFFRIQLGVVSRAEGHSAAKRSAYQSCGVVIAHDGQRFDFSRKASEHVAALMLAPPDAPDWTRDPELLWQRAATAEKRVDAQEARIVDFSMPRAVPAEYWADCIRRVYEPFLRMGMVLQVDVHDTPASDGGRNVNVHGLATLRELNGDGFAARKNRTWNDHFRERNGRAVREAFAERLTAFCREHGVDYIGDARPNAERDLPDPEPELPRWNFEYSGRTGDMPEALAALHEHRIRRREWEAAQAEAMEAALDLERLETRVRERRRRRLSPAVPVGARPAKPDRRAAILRAWHRNGWIDADAIPAIATVRFDDRRDLLWIALRDGTTLVDTGDAIGLRGRLTWQAALETAAAAERHGWTSVTVAGDQAYKDTVAVACMLRGIEVISHTLSPKAQAAFERVRAERLAESASKRHSQARSSLDVHLELTKRHFVERSPPLDGSSATEELPPAYRPRFRPPRKNRPDCSKV